jgi:hypothetical protein
MSRSMFGGSEDDYAVDAAGNPAQLRRVHFYTSAARTTEITDLASDAAGTGSPLTVTTDSQGFWGPVYGPSGTTVMYAAAEDAKGGLPTRVVAIYPHTAVDPAATYAPINPANWTQGNGTYVSLTGPNTITNPAGATDSALQIEQFATGAGDGQTYGLEVHRFDTTRSAVVIHDYANNSSEPSLWIDNTGAGPMLKLHNTQNLTTNPGHDGTGDFFIFADHDLTFCHTDKDFIWRFDNASRAKTFTVLNTAATPFSVQSTFNGTGLDVQKAGTGAGTAVRIANSGTGLAIDVRSATTSLWAVTAAGLPQWVAAGNQQTTVGAAGGASALPATPTKYVKIVDSAGTTLVVPAYAAS